MLAAPPTHPALDCGAASGWEARAGACSPTHSTGTRAVAYTYISAHRLACTVQAPAHTTNLFSQGLFKEVFSRRKAFFSRGTSPPGFEPRTFLLDEAT